HVKYLQRPTPIHPDHLQYRLQVLCNILEYQSEWMSGPHSIPGAMLWRYKHSQHVDHEYAMQASDSARILFHPVYSVSLLRLDSNFLAPDPTVHRLKLLA